MFARLRCSWVALVLASTFACGDSGGSDDGEDESGNFDEGTGLGEGECSDVCGMADCGTCPSATMVDGGGFMIDALEVTNEAYAAMLEIELDASLLPPGCEWKSGFEPEGWTDDLDGDLPVVGVDWCDAMVYCEWAGKQLCGGVDGGSADYDVQDDAEGDAWYRACSNGGASTFPYGESLDPAACNGSEAGNDALLAGGSLATCEGGVPGLYDMSGNVWEWTNACASASGDGTTECRRRGGSRFSEGDNLRCAVNSTRARGERDNAVGFRCCLP